METKQKINISGIVSLCLGSASAVVVFCQSIHVPERYLWVGGLLGAAIAFMGWIVPLHTRHIVNPDEQKEE